MTRMVLVGPELEENLSLRYLGAHAQRSGHGCTILAFDGWHQMDAVARRILELDPDLVGLSLTFQSRAEEMLTLAERLRRGGFAGHVTTGGHFATFTHERILSSFLSVDSVCRFNADETLVQLAGCVQGVGDLSGIPGLSRRDPGTGRVRANPPDAQSRPSLLEPGRWPDRSGPRARQLGLATAPVVTSQGCWGRCSFCCIHAFRSAQGQRSIMRRSTGDLADEMAYLFRHHDVRIFVMQDDNLFTASQERNVRWAQALHEALERREVDTSRISTAVKIRPESVTHGLVETLRTRLGLVRAFVGVENMSEAGLRALYRGLTVEQNLEALQVLDRQDVYPCYNVLLIHPWATLDEIGENLANLRRAPARFPFNVCRTEVYHGTAIHRRLRDEGRLRGGWLNPGYEVVDPRVEVLFRIMDAAFAHRSFHLHGSVNEAMTLGYDVSVARRHWPGTRGLAGLVLEAADEIARVNETTLDLLEQMHALVSEAPLAKQDVESFALELCLRVGETERGELLRLGRIRRALQERIRQGDTRGAARLRRPLGQLASWTAIPAVTMALGGCAWCKPPGVLEQGEGEVTDRQDAGSGGGGLVDRILGRENTDGLKTTFLPWAGRYHGESPFYNRVSLLVEHEGGPIAGDVDVKVTAADGLQVLPLMSPDRTRIMIDVSPRPVKRDGVKSHVTVQLTRGEEVVEYHRTYFRVYENGKLTHGPDAHDLDEDVRIMDPVPVSTMAIDLTPEKNVDIIYSERTIHGSTTSGMQAADGAIRWEFDSVDGKRMLNRGLELYAMTRLDEGEKVSAIEINASAGEIRRATVDPMEERFTWMPPVADDMKSLQGGDHHIDVVYTVQDRKGREKELSGRATITIEDDGDLVIRDVTLPDPVEPDFSGLVVKSLPRTLRVVLGVTDRTDGRLELLERVTGSPETSPVWECSAGTLHTRDGGAVSWVLPEDRGVHRVTCTVHGKDGALSVAHHFETV